eukprot:TRINITY_DN1270_c0_g1_i7.p1 TRINITY_DN1270_c0_g1~~TRINITY_DN1270_c0_g1_i7.p1  ORF type:complete len:654 (-),score=77.05 TRINITY_DN1270_c0_g1_i7:171-2132(-)
MCIRDRNGCERGIMELGETAPFEIDDSYTAVKKSDAPQDIDRLTFDEKLDEVEKTAACLGSSNIFQQIFALVSFPRLLRNAQLKPRALALLTESNLGFLSSGKTELMIAAAQSFTEILDSAVLCPVELDQHLFPVLQNAYLNRLSALDPVVSLLWRELFVEMMRQLAVSVLRGKVLQIVLSKSQYSQPTHNRTLAANTVGILCELLDHETVEQELFAQAMCLCQDTDYEVRAIMCGQLPQIARAVSADLVNKRILEELLDLVGDEILEVRLQAVDTMISMCDVFETEIRATQILPIVKQICRNVSDDVSLTLAANFGLLACKLSADLVADGDSLMIFETFKGLAKNPDSTCRKHCAFNFPAMVKTSGAAKFAVHLLDTLVALSADEAVPVRQTIAAGIHEIALILGGQRSITHLKPVIITLFTDSSMAVCEAVVPKVGVILGVLRSDDSGEPQQALWHEMLSPLLALQTTVEHKWRVHLPLLKQWRGLPDWYTNRNDIYEHFVPVLLTAMNAAPNVVAQEAASVLCLCIRRNNFDFQQRAMCQRILREFGRASRWSLRMLFLDFCEMVMTTFSRRFFRTHFLDHILMMDTDRVPNVRKRLAQLLPAIAEALPPNSIHSEKLEGILECFHQDRDRDVVETTTCLLYTSPSPRDS